jgi:hypothetical protein
MWCASIQQNIIIRKNKKQLYYLRKEEEKCFYDFGEEFGDKIP